jgi:hypothetical protein
MIWKNLQVHYTHCAHCGSSSYISSYQPKAVMSLEALCKAVHKVCTSCGNKLGIREIKVDVVKMR